MSKPSVLLMVHCYNNRGGVEEHTRVLERELTEWYEPFVVYPEGSLLHLRHGGKVIAQLPVESCGILAPFHAPLFVAALQEILAAVNPSIVHVLHFVNWPLAALEVVANCDCRKVISFHDYFLLTPHYTLQGGFGPADTLTVEYSRATFGADLTSYLTERRVRLNTALAKFHGWVVPSDHLAKELSQVFPLPFRKVPYGIYPFVPIPKDETTAGRLRFGYIGSLIPQKGWEWLVRSFTAALDAGMRGELHLFGAGPGKLPADTPEISFHGAYGPEDLPAITGAVDVGVIPSLFAETYSIVLSEFWQARRAVIVSDIGALGERVVHGRNGYKVTPGSDTELAAALGWFASQDEWRGWEIPEVFHVDRMLNELRALYGA